MRKLFEVSVPTGTDFAAAAKAARLNFAAQLAKLASAAEPKSEEQLLQRIEAKELARKNKIASRIKKLKAKL